MIRLFFVFAFLIFFVPVSAESLNSDEQRMADWIDAHSDDAIALLKETVDIPSGSLSLGDDYTINFDEAMDVSVIQDGTQDANAHLRPAGGFRYGDLNSVSWSPDGRDLTVTVTDGFTILGDELVDPSSFVTDTAGNPVLGTQQLQGKDTVPPQIVSVEFDDADGSGDGDARRLPWHLHIRHDGHPAGVLDHRDRGDRHR